MKRSGILLFALSMLSFLGCPDYSHQRAAPNYDNMQEEDSDPVSVDGEANLSEE